MLEQDRFPLGTKSCVGLLAFALTEMWKGKTGSIQGGLQKFKKGYQEYLGTHTYGSKHEGTH